jgi:hypothetical protein
MIKTLMTDLYNLQSELHELKNRIAMQENIMSLADEMSASNIGRQYRLKELQVKLKQTHYDIITILNKLNKEHHEAIERAD